MTEPNDLDPDGGPPRPARGKGAAFAIWLAALLAAGALIAASLGPLARG